MHLRAAVKQERVDLIRFLKLSLIFPIRALVPLCRECPSGRADEWARSAISAVAQSPVCRSSRRNGPESACFHSSQRDVTGRTDLICLGRSEERRVGKEGRSRWAP